MAVTQVSIRIEPEWEANWSREDRPVGGDPQNGINHSSRAIDANVLSQSVASSGRTK